MTLAGITGAVPAARFWRVVRQNAGLSNMHATEPHSGHGVLMVYSYVSSAARFDGLRWISRSRTIAMTVSVLSPAPRSGTFTETHS